MKKANWFVMKKEADTCYNLQMDKVTFQRVIKAGFTSFFRNGLVSVATVLVMSLSMFMLGTVLIGSIFLGGVISNIQDKVDISVYFKPDSSEADILSFKQSLSGSPDVKSVSYISRDEALKSFMDRHKGDELVLRSIEAVDSNPFSASINIKSEDPSRYEAITQFIEKSQYLNLVDKDSSGGYKITYRQNQAAIDKLSLMLSTIKKIGLSMSLILGLIALVVSYNTVRLAIYNSKDEISVMQLVGATRFFIRGPFLIEGLIHGIISSVFTVGIFYPLLWWAGQKTAGVFGGLNVFDYFSSNIFQVSAILFGVSILLGVGSAFVATRRYLRV